MKIFGKNKQSGFSLVELMIVVGIIGVLATLALPRFKQFQSKAKMAEAMNVLQHVYTLEQSYSLDNNNFIGVTTAVGANTGTANTNNCTFTGNADTLGFRIEPCLATSPTPRFSYTVAVPAAGDTFTATATTGAGGFNRICVGNPAFNIGLNQANATSWWTTAAPATPNGAIVVSTVCSL